MTTSLLHDVSAADGGLLFVICYCLLLVLLFVARSRSEVKLQTDVSVCVRRGGITELTFAI